MRFAAGVEYDGSGFLGWQRLPHGETVQGAVERALSKVVDASVSVTCSGRTDSGVHARCQVSMPDARSSTSISMSSAVPAPCFWEAIRTCRMPSLCAGCSLWRPVFTRAFPLVHGATAITFSIVLHDRRWIVCSSVGFASRWMRGGCTRRHNIWLVSMTSPRFEPWPVRHPIQFGHCTVCPSCAKRIA